MALIFLVMNDCDEPDFSILKYFIIFDYRSVCDASMHVLWDNNSPTTLLGAQHSCGKLLTKLVICNNGPLHQLAIHNFFDKILSI